MDSDAAFKACRRVGEHMAHVQVHSEDVALREPTLVEGLPGAGLVGKIAADHLVDRLDMTHYADIRCDGLPEVAVYRGGETGLQPPVRLYADGEHDLLVLQSDVPVSPSAASEFATCITGWLDDNGVTPLYLSGLSAEKEGVPELYGVATGTANDRLEGTDIGPPPEDGLVSGPTGALLHEAGRRGLDGVGLIVQAETQFADPEAARIILVDGVEALTGVAVETDDLVDQAEEIRQARERLAKRMQEADEESTQAQPLRMFQ